MATISEEEGQECGFGAYPVTQVQNYNLRLSDGVHLALKLWFPSKSVGDTCFAECKHYLMYNPSKAQLTQPQPAILEYLPYRKSDHTLLRDHRRHPWFCSHGYVCVRVDMRGTGDSEGLYYDEYAPQEQKDACEVIEWLSNQPWCNGHVGMYGKSWGGFNGLQVAALQPPALKAIISVYSTDDRYASDVHYMGGCVIGSEMLSWASYMFALNAKPPNPDLVPDWKERWISRLKNASSSWSTTWLSHQLRDDYWRHGSVCETPEKLTTPVLAIGGWRDLYRDPVLRMLQTLPCVRGILGPWAHDWPDQPNPGPVIGYSQECLKWWDCHLKGVSNGAMNVPLLRAYIQDSIKPEGYTPYRSGHWISESKWPPVDTQRHLVLVPDNATHSLRKERSIQALEEATSRTHFTALCGMGYGEIYIRGGVGEFPGDQRLDDSMSLCWQTCELEEDLSILGNPTFACTLSVEGGDRGLIAVRLSDVHPTGEATLIGLGMLNLTHQNGHAPGQQTFLTPGESFEVKVELMCTGYKIPKGHSLRMAVSSSYWPNAWPSPDPVTIAVKTGRRSRSDTNELPDFLTKLILPVYHPGREEVIKPNQEKPLIGPEFPLNIIRNPSYSRKCQRDLSSKTHRVTIDDDFGQIHMMHTEVVEDEQVIKTYEISEDDPLSAKANVKYDVKLEWPHSGAGINIHIKTNSEMTSDRENFYLTNSLYTSLNGEEVFQKTWQDTIERCFV